MRDMTRKLLSMTTATALSLSLLGLGASAAKLPTPKVIIQSELAEDTGIVSVTLSVEDGRFNVFQTYVDYDGAVVAPCTATGGPARNAFMMTDFLAPEAEEASGWLDTSLYSLDTKDTQVNAALMVSPNAREEGWTNGAGADGYTPMEDERLDLLTMYFKLQEGKTLTDESIVLGGDEDGASVLSRMKLTKSQGGTLEEAGVDFQVLAQGRSLVKDGGLTLELEPIGDVGGDPSDDGDGDHSGDSSGSGGNSNNGGTSGGGNASGGGSGSGSSSSGSSGSGSSSVSGDKPQAGQETKPADGTGGAVEVQLSDIQGHWAEAAIRRTAAMGIVTGYPDGRFGPDDTMTRGALAAILCRYYKLTPTEPTFADAKENWAAKEIGAVCAEGLMNGTGEDQFSPDDSVSRAMLATVLARAEGLATPALVERYSDDDQIPDWAEASVYATRGQGLMTGTPGGAFEPQREATRAEIVTVLSRLMDWF